MQVLSLFFNLSYSLKKLKLMKTIEKNLLENYLNVEFEVICNLTNKPSVEKRQEPEEETVSGITMTTSFIF